MKNHHRTAIRLLSESEKGVCCKRLLLAAVLPATGLLFIDSTCQTMVDYQGNGSNVSPGPDVFRVVACR